MLGILLASNYTLAEGPANVGTVSDLPLAVQWAAGILTIVAGMITLIWAAKRLGPPPTGTTPPQPVSVMSGQLVNDPQLGQLLISGQALIMKELQGQTSEIRQMGSSLERIEEELKWQNAK